MEEWQIRQKHHEDLIATHKKLGHMDALGRIRVFRGKPFFEEINKLGHTSGVLEECKCWQEQWRHQRRVTGHP